MQLISWLLLCLLVVFISRRRISRFPLIGIFLYLAVPSVARGIFVGQGPPFHPATLFVIVALTYLLLTQFKYLIEIALGAFTRTLLLVLLVSHAFILTLAGTGAVGQLYNNLIGPVALLALVGVSLKVEGRNAATFLVRSFLLFASAQSALGLAQTLLARPLVYEAQYARFYWFSADRFSRALGTLDSALDLALLLVVAIPLANYIRRPLLRVLCVAIMLGGVFATQSRLGVLLAVIGVLYVALSGETARIRIATAIGLLVASVALALSRFGQDFMSRAQNAGGSTMRRSEATQYILDNIFNNFLIGKGLNSSYGLRSGGTLGSSLENGFAMYAYDFGWVAAVLLLAFLGAAFSSCLLRADWSPALSMIILIIMVAGYSSFMTQSASGAIMFFVVALIGRASTHGSDTAGVADGLTNLEIKRLASAS